MARVLSHLLTPIVVAGLIGGCGSGATNRADSTPVPTGASSVAGSSPRTAAPSSTTRAAEGPEDPTAGERFQLFFFPFGQSPSEDEWFPTGLFLDRVKAAGGSGMDHPTIDRKTEVWFREGDGYRRGDVFELAGHLVEGCGVGDDCNVYYARLRGGTIGRMVEVSRSGASPGTTR